MLDFENCSHPAWMHKLMLLKDSKTHRLDINSQRHKTNQCITLYDGSKINAMFCEEERNNIDEQVKSMCEFLDDFRLQDVCRNFIRLTMLKNDMSDEFEIYIRVLLTNEFVEKLRCVLVQPLLSIQGRFSCSFRGAGNAQEEWNPFSCNIELDSEREHVIAMFEGSDKLKFLANQIIPPERDRDFTFEYTVSLTWKRFGRHPHPTRFSWMGKMMNEMLFSDCVIIPSNNKEINCHRNIIAAQSDVLHAMLTNGLQESQTNRIFMEDVSEEVVNSLLTYFYKNEVNIDEIGEDVANELFQVAHRYNVSNLESLMMGLFLGKPGAWFSLRTTLSLYFFTSKVDAFKPLGDKMVGILKRNAKQLRSTEAYQEFLSNNPKEATDLAFLLVERLAQN